jgi:PAS domain S-box-containing protein
MERKKKIGGSKQAEEILRDQNEELEATVEELRISEEELASQLEELQQSRDALKESERKFQDTVKNLDEGYYSVTTDGLLLDHNLAFNRMLGFDAAQDLKGAQLPDFWQNPDDRKEYLNELMARGFIRNYLINAKKTGGEKIVVMASAHLVKDEKGRLARIDGTFTDFTERKRAEEALKKSEERFSKVFQASPIGLSITRMADGQYIDVNEAFLSLFGYERGEALSHTSFQLQTWASPEERDRVVSILREQGRARNIEAQYRRKSGEIWTALVSAEVIEVAGERYALGLLQDITERKQAAEALRESEEKYRTLSEFTWDWIYLLDNDNRFVYCSPSCERITGYPAEEFLRDPALLMDIVHPEDRALVAEHLKAYHLFPDHGEAEFRLICRNGEVKWIEHVCKAVVTEDGRCLGRRSGNRDITESKQAEEELRINKDRLLFATEGANLGVWNWNTVTGELIWSDKCKALFGIPLDETMSYPRFSDALHPDDRERTDKAVKDALDNHKDYDIEYRSLWPDGSVHWLAAKGRGYYDATGKDVRLEGVVLDISERKRAEEALRRAVADLKRSNEELQQFAYVASHDLQEPLRAVASFTQLLSERYKGRLDKNADEFIAFAVDGAHRMQALINDLLSYSRLETRGKPPEPTDSHDALGQALANLGTAIRESGALVTNDDLPLVKADEGQLVQLFQNLVGNAIKFRGQEPPRVHVSAVSQGREWLFSVRDNGIGIAKEYHERIFSIFQRLHSREEYPGTGIGLALCKRIVERHGGTIRVESGPGSGSTFFFTLPKP